MANGASTYNLIKEFSDCDTETEISTSPQWILAIVRLGRPLSYSRATSSSVNVDITEGASTRNKTLIITSDCVSLSVSRNKESHLKSLNATLLQTQSNYLVEILPGDWILAWMIHDTETRDSLIKRIGKGEACNGFEDGFKFLGRVRSIRKRASRNRGSGTKNVRYQMQATAFSELDTSFFYDPHLASNTKDSQNLGRWLARMGLDIREIFAVDAEDTQKDNVHILIPKFFEVFLGVGLKPETDVGAGSTSALRATAGGGLVGDGPDKGVKKAPFAYLVPKEVGSLIGKKNTSNESGILSYADLIELTIGVQQYSSNLKDQHGTFTPDIDHNNPLTNGNHFFTGQPLLGAFLPYMPGFNNKPMWNLLSEYLNPVVNEMFTCLRTNADGKVMPSLILRQIPFTTDTLADKWGKDSSKPHVTKFSTLPRWIMPAALVHDIDLGRSDATRVNFVHVYGQDANVAKNVSITSQIVVNPPIRDDFDIQRSGLHAFMTTIACRVRNQVGSTPTNWIEMIADHRIGSQYTLNGTISCVGIQAPICEGDNLEFDGVIYHIESIEDSCSIDTDSGMRDWQTTITLTNGLRADATSDVSGDFPIYPGFKRDDNTAYDPGHDGTPYALDAGGTDTETQPADPNESDLGASADDGNGGEDNG